MTDERKTFTIPPGHEAVRDSEGRATGEVRRLSAATEHALLPCPFCGGDDVSVMHDISGDKPHRVYAYHVRCHDCHARGRNHYRIGWCESAKAACEAWNDRPAIRDAAQTSRVTDSDLVKRCQELLDWSKTGLLNGGSGGAVRELADRLRPKIGDHYALNVAENQTKDDAMREVVRLAAQPPAAPVETICEEAVIAAAGAMVRLGCDRRRVEGPMPTRGEEARACIEAYLAYHKPAAPPQSCSAGTIEAALRDAFPHFQDDAPITPEVIKKLGNEWLEMVMGWAPVQSKIKFMDAAGNEHEIKDEEGWYLDGVVTSEEEIDRLRAAPQEALKPDAKAEGLKRYPVRDPGNWDIDLNRHSRDCFIEGFEAALAVSRPHQATGGAEG